MACCVVIYVIFFTSDSDYLMYSKKYDTTYTTSAQISIKALQEQERQQKPAKEDEIIESHISEQESNKQNIGTSTSPSYDYADNNADQLRKKVVEFAISLVGNPYIYGGTDLYHGTDCSGFTMGVYKKFGYSLPRTSNSQSLSAKLETVSVNQTSLKPGDLIFYANASGTINHVAIYVGDGTVVHASNKKDGIKISSKWNYRKPKICKRVIKG